MKRFRILIEGISIMSYLLIMLAGSMMSFPLFIWLLFTLFDFGNIDQLFVIIALSGIALRIFVRKNRIFVIIATSAMMCAPLVSRIVQVPIELFFYFGFLIPLSLFLLTSMITLIFFINFYNGPNQKKNMRNNPPLTPFF